MLRRSLAVLTLLGAALAVGVASAGAATDRQRTPSLEFAGEVIFPTGLVFDGTVVGGLSSITYDPQRDVFYSIADDPSSLGPARFYTLRADLADGRLDAGDVHFTDVTTLLQPDGTPFPPLSLDPEGLVLLPDDTLVATSEGDAGRLIAPFVRRFDLDGRDLGELRVPDVFLPAPGGTRGVRTNLGLEAAGVTPNGRFLFTGSEGALAQDGPPATLAGGSPARLLRYNLATGKPDKQFVYEVGPVVDPPVPAGAFTVNGLVEVLPLSNTRLIAMERSFSVGAGNTIRLYLVELAGAQDVDRFDSLARLLGQIRPVKKTLLFDLDTLGLTLDNVEGITFGPELPDGRRSLVLVSDNNFSPAAFTQFLAFAYSDR